MEVKLKSAKENKIQLIVNEVSPSFINAIRRACMFQVPTLAIEDVYFSKNDSALYDEQVALRLGLLALKTDSKSLKLPSECSCKGEGCSKCQVKFKINVEGPRMVYARDFKNESMLYGDTPIVLLLNGQNLELVAVAQLGLGEEHAKWNSGLATYQCYPKIKVGSGNIKEGVKACPKDVFENDKVVHLENCDLCEGCVKPSEGAISIETVPEKYIFTYESWGQLEPLEALKQAAQVVKDKVGELSLK